MLSYAAAIAIIAASGVNAGSHRGKCSDLKIGEVSKFDQSRIEGRWYEIARDSDFADTSKSCVNEDIYVNFNGTLTTAKNAYTLENGWEQTLVNSILVKGTKGHYNIYGEDEDADREADPDVYIVATDYETWMIEYTCIDLIPGSLYFDSVSIKARERELSPSLLETMDLLIVGAVPSYNNNALTYSH